MQDLLNGRGRAPRAPSPKGASRVGLCGGGGGGRCKYWAPGAGDPRYATVYGYYSSTRNSS